MNRTRKKLKPTFGVVAFGLELFKDCDLFGVGDNVFLFKLLSKQGKKRH